MAHLHFVCRLCGYHTNVDHELADHVAAYHLKKRVSEPQLRL